MAGAVGRRQEASSRQRSRLSFLCLPSVTGHKSHEARRKTRRCPEFKYSTPATPGPQLPAGAEHPANTVGSRSCVGGTISAGRGSCCCLAAEAGIGPALRALPAAGSGRGNGGRRAGRALPSGRRAPTKDAAPGWADRSLLRRLVEELSRRPGRRGAPRPDGARTAHPHRARRGRSDARLPRRSLLPSPSGPKMVGRPTSLPFLLPLLPSRPPTRPAPPEPARRPRPGPAGQLPFRPSWPRLSGDPAPGPRLSRECGNGDPRNTPTPPPAATLTCAGLTSRGRGQRRPPSAPLGRRLAAALRGAAGMS